MVVKTEPDTDDIIDYPHDDQPSSGMLGLPMCCIICIHFHVSKT